MAAIVACVVGGIVALTLSLTRDSLIVDRQVKTQSLVETAYSTVQRYGALEASGAMSREDAQAAAKEELRALRYEDGNYFWIASDANLSIMHPIRPDMEGKDMGGLEDSNGLRIFQAMSEIAKAPVRASSPTHGRARAPRSLSRNWPMCRASSPGAGSSALAFMWMTSTRRSSNSRSAPSTAS